MTDRDTLLRRLLHRIQRHGYYHTTDVALVDWLAGSGKIAESARAYFISPDALYKQIERLKKVEVSE